VILGGRKTYVVQATTRKPYGKVQSVSALSMKRVDRHPKSQLFVVVIGEVDGGGVGTPISPTLANVLDDFSYSMLDSLPKVLLPRCTIDHCIELELGVPLWLEIYIQFLDFSWKR
jgi:hypothetical protein